MYTLGRLELMQAELYPYVLGPGSVASPELERQLREFEAARTASTAGASAPPAPYKPPPPPPPPIVLEPIEVEVTRAGISGGLLLALAIGGMFLGRAVRGV